MASITGVQQLAATLVARCKTLINNDLKRICKEEGLPQSGIKAQLQTRVIQRMPRSLFPLSLAHFSLQ